MDKFILRIFQQEATTQCQFVVLAASELNYANWLSEASFAPDADPNDVTLRPGYYQPRIWFSVQNILVSSANLSKLLWGSGRNGPDARAEAEAGRHELRESLQVEDDSPLKSTTVRNRFEHFDQRLEKWRQGGGQIFIGRNIGDPNAVHTPSEPDRFGHYDPATGIVTILGETSVLPDLVAEAQRILPLASTLSSGI